MEACNSEIRIFFSLPELELIHRALERFGHVESVERRSPTRSDHVQHVNRVLDKILPVHSALKCETSITKKALKTQEMVHPVAETERRLKEGAAFNGFLFSRGELEEIL
jgi:hypothetical protein